MEYNPFCLSSFLAFRYVARRGEAWLPGIEPTWPEDRQGGGVPVRTADDVLEKLRGLVHEACAGRKVALFLSGGIDSAILGALMPKGSRAYTIRFAAEGALDESEGAALFARAMGLDHRIVTVTWDDYVELMPVLMRAKRAPLHAVEVGLCAAARAARADGFASVMVGNGADSTFGGLDKLLSRDWTMESFMERYTFIRPESVLAAPVPVRSVYATYARGSGVYDVESFLKEVHGRGIIQAFDNAIRTGGCSSVEPYEELRLDGVLDLARIRAGESKYLLREVFTRLYGGSAIPPKVAFARPMDVWLRDAALPHRPEFKTNLRSADFTGEQQWLIHCLAGFLDVLERAS